MDTLKVPLFINFKERLFVSIFILLIFSLNLSYEYYKFSKITSVKFYETKANVLNQYLKNNHHVLKLKSYDGFTFYTTSKEDLKNLQGRDVEILLIKTDRKISFLQYLKNFYYVTYIKKVLPDISLKRKISNFINSQHTNKNISSIYSALFLATPISKEIMEKISFFGLSHLIAISGFHFSLIAFFVFIIFISFYSFFHYRFFPYRNKIADSIYFISIVTFFYALFLGEVASVWRAFFMLIVGYFFIFKHIKILSFETLFWVMLLILSIFSKFLFSLGFWFSVIGVFYIFLFIKSFSNLKKWQIFIFLNIYIYFMMLPIIHYFFENFSYIQLFSPIMTIIFTIFYPLSLIFHIFGFGDIFDSILNNLFNIEFTKYAFKTPFWFFALYLLLSLFSIYKKRIFFFTILMSFAFFIYNIANLQSI
ncbi:ComEC/Rec2 family competence protein [Nitrosophilus kaiyonis]|uniref:ComEC/Rec2 family competence protein n=1 Tax=Nitrosophilus kaiyonis TaxID=2930200 RepID=UPI0024929C12|nr:ComEC/Rec2 family competence protein [Nitrosophilus kaiyonis]